MTAIMWTLLSSFVIALIVWIPVTVLSYVYKISKGIRIIKIGGVMTYTLLILIVLLDQLSSPLFISELPLKIYRLVFADFFSLNFQMAGIVSILNNVIVYIWLCGLIFGLLKFGRNLYHLHTLLSTSVTATNKMAIQTLKRISSELGIRREVKLLISPLITTPYTAGVLKPIIYFPIGLISGMSSAELDVVLRHELAHIKRYDFLVNLYLKSHEIIFFFNPILLMLIKNVRKEMEFTCDDTVLKTHKRLFYAQTLLKLHEIKCNNKLLLGIKGEACEFNIRIRRIISRQIGIQPHIRNLHKASIFFLLLISSLVILKLSMPNLPTNATIYTYITTEPTHPDELAPNGHTPSFISLKNNISPPGVSDYGKFMDEINSKLIKDGIINDGNQKIILRFKDSNIIKGKELLGERYSKYIELFRKNYPPLFDNKVSTWLFHT